MPVVPHGSGCAIPDQEVPGSTLMKTIISTLAAPLAVLAGACVRKACESLLWKEFHSDAEGGRCTLLSDFSYAVHHHGDPRHLRAGF